MDKIGSKNKLSNGYSINKKISDNQLNKKFQPKKDKDKTAKNYPNGIIPLVTLLLFYIIFIIVVLSIGFTNDNKDIFILRWHNTLLSAAVVYLLMNILWAIGRTGLTSYSGYYLMRMSRLIRTNKLREKLEFFVHDAAINDVNSAAEYIEFCQVRKQYTKKLFYISLIISSSIFIISLIIWFAVEYS